METIDHLTLSHLADAGSVQSAKAIGQAGGWSIVVRYGAYQRALAASRSKQVRVFKKLETLVGYLATLGITQFEVDSTAFDPNSPQRTQRPDRSAALHRAHQAAAYDQYVRSAVQAAQEDPTPGIPHEQAQAQFAAKRAELEARAAKGKKC